MGVRYQLALHSLWLVIACGLGEKDVYEKCKNSDQCGYPETVFECVATDAGKICTTSCQGDVDAASDGVQVGRCVADSTCQTYASEACCLVENLEEGGGSSIGGDDRYTGTCLPRAPESTGPNDPPDETGDGNQCESGTLYYTSCDRDDECGYGLTCMRPCTSCDESCLLPCGGELGGDDYCERFGAGSCGSTLYEVCDAPPSICPDPPPDDHGETCSSNADCESAMCWFEDEDSSTGRCTMSCMSKAECPNAEDCQSRELIPSSGVTEQFCLPN